ncbi:kinase-like protein, partial [Dendrothele bispora CBS 962.96]
QWLSTPDEDRRVVWLVEPFRLSSPERFSKPMNFVMNTEDDKIKTLNAFVHYAFQSTGDDFLYADLQGSLAKMMNGSIGIVLFDPMTHSGAGDSGVGDEGPQAHELYATQHVCDEFCDDLGLNPLLE